MQGGAVIIRVPVEGHGIQRLMDPVHHLRTEAFAGFIGVEQQAAGLPRFVKFDVPHHCGSFASAAARAL